MSNENLMNFFKELLRENQFPNIQLVCPDENIITSFMKSVTDIYSESYEFLLEINILDIQSEQTVINNIISFNSIKSLTNNVKLQKLLIIHQFSEPLSEPFLNALEDCLKSDNLRIIILTTSFHINSDLLKPKIITFNLKPESTIQKKIKSHESDVFYNCIETSSDDLKLSKIIQEWSYLHCLKLPHEIFDEYYNHLLVKI